MELGRDEEADEVLTEYLAELPRTEDTAERFKEVLGRLLELESRLEADAEAYERAKAAGAAASYGDYLSEYPSGRHAEEARQRQAEAKDDEAYERAQRAGTAAWYENYLTKYPNGRHAEEARRQHAEAKDDEAYRRARSAGTSDAYEVYLREHPDGRHAEEARRLQTAIPEDDAAYEQAKESGTAESYEDYLTEYPSGRHADEARQRQAAIREDDAAFERAKDSGTAEVYRDYLGEHPSGRHAEEARQRQAEAEDDEAYDRAQKAGTAAWYEQYLSEYPNGRHAEEARRQQAEAEAKDDEAYERAKRADTTASYGEYLREYPNGRHAAEARRKQAEGRDDEAYERARATDTSASYGGYLRAYANGRHAAQARQLQAAAVRREEEGRIGGRFRDCEGCPELVVVPAGSFMMGSRASEEGRYDSEGPVHRVTISEAFAVGVYEVTRGEFGRFVAATGHKSGDSCWFWDGEWTEEEGKGWRDPGFVQTERHPVVCVSWKDVQAYVKWLSGETGEEYRLLSASEWEYVARGGTGTARYWGGTESGQCRNANGADRQTDYSGAVTCDDGYEWTAPVGSYGANGYGLYDVLGNVWEWTEDCWNESYEGAPSDGRAWESGECGRRVVRGGSWYDLPRFLRSAYRFRNSTGFRFSSLGFRVARTLGS